LAGFSSGSLSPAALVRKRPDRRHGFHHFAVRQSAPSHPPPGRARR
jgi:hypothetical protein